LYQFQDGDASRARVRVCWQCGVPEAPLKRGWQADATGGYGLNAPLASLPKTDGERSRPAVGVAALRIHAIAWASEAVRLVELRDPDGAPLPAAAPGAHIDLHLAGGLVRSYSLMGDPEDRRAYSVAVLREPMSRGGSRAVHETLRVGDVLAVEGPRIHFPLVEDAPYSVLIAGGIGITPILPMAERLARLGRRFELHYGARRRADAVLLDRLAPLGAAVRLHFSREAGGRRADIAAILASAPAGAHFYCCGPASMLDDYTAASADLEPARVHLERFAAAEPAAVEGGFVVELARTGRTIAVPPGKTILEALNAHGIEPACSCIEGVCGTCETRVLDGVPDHRDVVLTPEERAGNRTMMICVSGAKSDRLVLDL
jgi:vanillate O-demethylase ferredoxin subunit